MNPIANNEATFISTIRELHEFYRIFSAFNDEELSAERRDIILENLTCQMMKAEKEYTLNCVRT